MVATSASTASSANVARKGPAHEREELDDSLLDQHGPDGCSRSSAGMVPGIGRVNSRFVHPVFTVASPGACLEVVFGRTDEIVHDRGLLTRGIGDRRDASRRV